MPSPSISFGSERIDLPRNKLRHELVTSHLSRRLEQSKRKCPLTLCPRNSDHGAMNRCKKYLTSSALWCKLFLTHQQKEGIMSYARKGAIITTIVWSLVDLSPPFSFQALADLPILINRFGDS